MHNDQVNLQAWRRRVAVLCSLALFQIAAASAPADSRVNYRVEYGESGYPSVRIRIAAPESLAGPAQFVFPRAIPMGYGEHPFDGFVGDLRAFSEKGDLLPASRSERSRWTLGTQGTGIRAVEYVVDIGRMEREILSGADSSKLRRGYAGLLGYTIFGYLEGTENRPVRLEVQGPPSWPVFSTLLPQAPPARERMIAEANDFYALADSQILMGPDLQVRRLEATQPLFLAVYTENEISLEMMAGTVREAFEAVVAYFAQVPFKHYTVCQEYLRPMSDKHEYGFSMEHLDSGTFFFASDQALTKAASSADRARALYNFAHHVSHAWIPKRSYGEGYFPFRWEQAPLIDTIWFSEGFPQYAAIEALADTMPPEAARTFRDKMVASRFRNNLKEAPDFIRKLSLIELSRLASTRYSEDFRIGRNIFSRGGLMAAEMDERIRRGSREKKRLRDALRYLVAWSARNKRPFRMEELPVIFAEATGVDTKDILERWLPPPEGEDSRKVP